MRSSWDKYFMDIAFAASKRSTCDRRSVGCVLAKDNHQISMGYNGAPKSAPHCEETNHGCPEDQEVVSCKWAVHAEMNAISNAASRGVSVDGSTAYITDEPCVHCYGMLVNAGIERIVAKRPYDKGPEYTVVDVEIFLAEED